MRIGIFTDTYPPYINGVSTSIVMLKRALEAAGNQVFIVTVNDNIIKYKYEDENSIIRIPGVPIGIYDYRLTGIYPLKAIGKIKKWNLDVIHSQTEFGVGTFARILAKQFKIPLVHTYHTMYEDYVHYITKGYFDGASKKILEYLTKFYCDKTAAELIVPTAKTYKLFKEKYKVEIDTHIIPTGIEIDRFYKENVKKSDILAVKNELNLDESNFVSLFVGRVASEKNIGFLIDNYKTLIRSNKNIKLIIVGDGPEIKKYKNKVTKNKLDNNIIFTGKVLWEKIPAYYQAVDVFVTASKTETQGLTVIEAMAASLPPLCIEDESFRTVVIDSLNGRIFKNSRDFKKIVRELVESPSLIKKMGKQAKITSADHSSKLFAERVFKVYEKAIDVKSTKVPKKRSFMFWRKTK